MDMISFAVAAYRAVGDRLRAEEPQIDEQTLADTIEGRPARNSCGRHSCRPRRPGPGHRT